MTSITENTFGARLLNAQNILTYLEGLADYEPPQATESINGMKQILIDIVESNTKASEEAQHYRVAVKNRQDAFRNNDTSLLKLLPPIRGAVESAYGKDSPQTAGVLAIINKMRNTRLIPSPPPAEGQQVVEPISQSQQSYGSLTKAFNDLINTITQLGGYKPSNADLQIANLQVFAAILDTLNVGVAQAYQKVSFERHARQLLYDDLRDRVQRIKAYLKSQYGLTSKIYNLVKGLNV